MSYTERAESQGPTAEVGERLVLAFSFPAGTAQQVDLLGSVFSERFGWLVESGEDRLGSRWVASNPDGRDRLKVKRGMDPALGFQNGETRSKMQAR